MSLTFEQEQRLRAVSLSELFGRYRDSWAENARATYEFLQGNFPDDAAIRRDDVRKALYPIIEVDQRLRAELNRKKLSQKYWIGDFTDLIIERTWNEIQEETNEK